MPVWLILLSFVVLVALSVVAGARSYRRSLKSFRPDRTAPLAPCPMPRKRTDRAEPVLHDPRPFVVGGHWVDWRRIASVHVTPSPACPLALPESTECDDSRPENDPEWSGYPWYDERTCWGCEKSCKRRSFRPYAGMNIGAEIRVASVERARKDKENPYHSGFAPRAHRGQVGVEPSTTVEKLWDWTCEQCGRFLRRVAAGLEPAPLAPVVGATDAEECPF